MTGAWEIYGPEVAIAIPHTGHVTMAWTYHMQKLKLPQGANVVLARNHPLDIDRDLLVKKCLDMGMEEIIMVDSDTIPPEMGALQLLSYQDADIISGMYYAKKPDHIKPCAWKRFDNEGPVPVYHPLEAPPANRGLVEVDTVGMGFCRIKRWVFEEMKPPWYFWSADRFNKDGIIPADGTSEDFYFCNKAKRELNAKIFVDFEVKCHHAFDGIIDGEDGKMKLIHM